MSDAERGEKLTLGPFQFRTPDRPCRIADCEERADGVVDMENGTINACIYCAPQFLQHEGNEWTPLAGGRSLQTDGDQRD
jgi:hypothetical protein